MPVTTKDPAVAMFQHIINFDEMYFSKLPDMKTARDRRQTIFETMKHLISDQVERVSYDSHVSTLDHYKDVFQETWAICKEDKSPETIMHYEYCITMLKLLTGRFRMRMLLHDLQQTYEDLSN